MENKSAGGARPISDLYLNVTHTHNHTKRHTNCPVWRLQREGELQRGTLWNPQEPTEQPALLIFSLSVFTLEVCVFTVCVCVCVHERTMLTQGNNPIRPVTPPPSQKPLSMHCKPNCHPGRAFLLSPSPSPRLPETIKSDLLQVFFLTFFFCFEMMLFLILILF